MSDDRYRVRAYHRTQAGILLLALVIRAGVLAMMPAGLSSDTDAYRALAVNVQQHGVLGDGVEPTAYRPPLYPMALRMFVRNGTVSATAIGGLHLVLGIVTVWLTSMLACRWGVERMAWLAALLVAFDPILLNQSTQIMTETLAAFLAVLCLLCLTWAGRTETPASACVVGGTLALAALCRPAFLCILGVAWLVTLLVGTGRRRWVNALAMAIAAAIVIAPWAIRNYFHYGRPIVATTHGGYTLLLGNNPDFYRHLREADWGTVWDAEHFIDAWRTRAEREISMQQEDRNVDAESNGAEWELYRDRYAYDDALRHIREQPGMFAYACLVRLGRMWGLVPHQIRSDESIRRRLIRYAVGCWHAVILLAAVLGAWRQGRGLVIKPWLWGALFCLCLTAVHVFYWSNLRMRAPLVPIVAVSAAAGVGLLQRDQHKPNPPV